MIFLGLGGGRHGLAGGVDRLKVGVGMIAPARTLRALSTLGMAAHLGKLGGNTCLGAVQAAQSHFPETWFTGAAWRRCRSIARRAAAMIAKHRHIWSPNRVETKTCPET